MAELHEIAEQKAREDWRYLAGIEEGQSRRGSETRHMEAQRDMALIAFYKADPAGCAKLCDEMLDTRGGLLGRVREWVAEGQ